MARPLDAPPRPPQAPTPPPTLLCHAPLAPLCPPLPPPYPPQFFALLVKFRSAYWRTPSYNFVRLAMTVVTGLVYGSVYWGQGSLPDPSGIANVQVGGWMNAER